MFQLKKILIMNKLLVSLLLLMLSNENFIYCQNSCLIYGSWFEYNSKYLDQKVANIYNNELDSDLTLTFYKDGTVKESLSNILAPFYIIDTLLLLGDRKYIIETISDTILIYRDFNEYSPRSPFLIRHYFKKVP